MFTGDTLWGDALTGDLERREILGRNYLLYRGVERNLYDAVVKTRERYPDKTALVDNYGRSYSYEDYMKKVDCFAQYLFEELGVRRHKKVGLMLYNGIEFCVAFLALVKLGAVTVPLPSKYKKPEVLSLVEKAQLDGVICEKDFCRWFWEFTEKTGGFLLESGEAEYGYGFAGCEEKEIKLKKSVGEEDDDVIIMFTSGTTSQSKGAVLKNFNVMHAVISYQKVLHITEADKSIIPVPIYHITGMVALLGLFLYSGATLYLHRQFCAERVLQCVKDQGLTFIHSSPTIFILLLAEKEKFPSLPTLRAFACGSSNMAKEKLKELHRWLPEMCFYTVYGLTETSSPATIFPGDAAVSAYIGSSGIPIPGTEFKIVSDEGKEVPEGEKGEVLIRGSVVLDRYLNLQTETLSQDGWLCTGDIGYFNKEGFLFIVDRKKDMINYGGEKVPSFDVENEIYKMPQIYETAVVGVPDACYGEVVGAAVALQPGADLGEEEIRDFLKDKLAKYKRPKKIMFLDEIPKTPNGKIDKRTIKKLFIEKEEQK
ncbi:acyl--CoA ligase [Blautia schinkii]|nr:acyl--CoA ligase [Blautia schinkii]